MNINVVAAKAPLLAYNSFIEAIFVLNNYTGHGGFSASQGSQSSQGSDRGSTLLAMQ
jgi:condensin-2 complex subunit D3